MKKPIPDIKTLNKLLCYEPDTGKLFWRERHPSLFVVKELAPQWNKRFAGTKCGSIKSNGYEQVCLMGTIVASHRIAWAVTYGSWPDGQIDHINGIRHDNRIENLRNVSAAQNQRNLKLRKDNKSGFCGVSWNTDCEKWQATISLGGKAKNLGVFRCITAALIARKSAENGHGFTERHGTS